MAHKCRCAICCASHLFLFLLQFVTTIKNIVTFSFLTLPQIPHGIKPTDCRSGQINMSVTLAKACNFRRHIVLFILQTHRCHLHSIHLCWLDCCYSHDFTIIVLSNTSSQSFLLSSLSAITPTQSPNKIILLGVSAVLSKHFTLSYHF